MSVEGKETADKAKQLLSDMASKVKGVDWKAQSMVAVAKIKQAKGIIFDFWNSGVKGKAICGSVIGLILVTTCLLFFGKSEEKHSSPNSTYSISHHADEVRKHVEAEEAKRRIERDNQKQTLKETMMASERKAQEEAEARRIEAENEAIRVAKMEAERKQQQEEERRNLAEEEERSMPQVETLIVGCEAWGRQIEYAPKENVALEEYLKGYYAIEDAFLPRVTGILGEFENGRQVFLGAVAKDFMEVYRPRADHLIDYVCKTGLKPTASIQEKKTHINLVKQAVLLQRMITEFAFAFGQDDTSSLQSAKKTMAELIAVRKQIPSHVPDAKAEDNYVSPPLPVDLESALENARSTQCGMISHIKTDWRNGEPHDASNQDKESKYRKRTFKGIPLRKGFPVASICGMKFCRPQCENGENLTPVFAYLNGSYGEQGYELKKPFRLLKNVVVQYSYPRMNNGESVLSAEFEALRYVLLYTIVPNEVNHESCLDELRKIKEVVEKKYQLNLGVGKEIQNGRGAGYVYGIGLPGGGWVTLGLWARLNSEGYQIKDGGYVMGLEIGYGSQENVDAECELCKKQLEAERHADAESKKLKLNISTDVGADVL